MFKKRTGTSRALMTEPIDWTWCLDLPQRFDSLLAIAEDLTTAQRRPGEDDETGGRVLNLYLVVCALVQILNDHLDRSRWGSGAGLWLRLGLRHEERQLRQLARALALSVLDDDRTPSNEHMRAIARQRATRWPATLRSSRLRVPVSFRASDLYPTDCELIADRAAQTKGEADPVLVVGLSTSGWYLGPLLAAALERRGHRDVDLLALRTDRPPPARVARAVRELSERKGWILLVGDSEGVGGGFKNALGMLTEFGLHESRVCLGPRWATRRSFLTLTDPDDCDTSACDVALREDERHIHRLLSHEVVEQWLNRGNVLERLNADAAAVMGGDWVETGQSQSPHVQRLFEVELRRDDQRWREFVLGRGVGPGLFGYHAWLAAICLRDRVPDALGIQNGVLFLRWETGEELSGPIEPADLDEIATYVAARARRLALRPQTTSKTEAGPVGEATLQVARVLSRPLGLKRDASLSRVAGLIARVPSSARSVVDGHMCPSDWVRLPNRFLLKRDFVAGSPEITDPVHDLAATVIGFGLDRSEERHLVETYERLTGDSNNLSARLAVHKLQLGWSELTDVHSLGFDLKTRAGRVAFARELVIRETLLTRTVNGYLADIYLTDISADVGGKVWALDIDGSVETDRMGFESTSPAGVNALRLLLTHGQRVFGCTVSSLGELRERCRTFGLLGGVAERGGVIWDDQRKEALPMISEEARLSIGRLREALLNQTDVLVDPRYQYSLRLFRYTDDGRLAVNRDEVRAVMAHDGIKGLDLIEDRRWTMVCASEVGMAEAFQRMCSIRGMSKSLDPVRVIGGNVWDLELMREAEACYAPASAGPDFRTGAAGLRVRFATKMYQVGTLHIVRRALHGSRGSCGACRLHPMPRLRRADSGLVAALGLQDYGRRSLLDLLR